MSVPDLNRIVDYLMKKDSTPLSQSAGMPMGDNIFNDEWPSTSDELLDNFFSMDGALLDLPSNGVDDLNPLVFAEPEPARSLAGSDSGLSMDHADLDMIDQQLSPLMMHQSTDDDILHSSFINAAHQSNAAASPQSSSSPGHSSPSLSDVGSPIDCYEDKMEMGSCQNTTPKDFKQPVQTFQNVTNLKRKSSTCPPATIVLPKVSKNIIGKREILGKNIQTMRNDKQKIILSNGHNASTLSSNIQIVNNQTLTVQSADVSSTQKKIIRVAPVAGNSRSILLPVTIKDMKDLRSIKIINATDLKNPANIKLAAANFLQKSKQQALENKKKNNLMYATFDTDDQQYMMEDSTSDRGSGHSDDDDDDRMGDDDIPVTRNKNGQFPRLELTNEEKRLLIKEGISLPSCYPLTRLEERELKRIRRKIRNKISAQDSRRRKKEYVDGLEDRVKQCTDENQSLIRKIKALQSQNQSLASQLKKLRSIVTKNSGGYKSAQPATCLMVLLLSVALVMAPSLRTGSGPAQNRAASQSGYAPHSALLNSIRRALLSAQTAVPSLNIGVNPMEESIEDIVNVDEVSSFGQPLSDHNYPLMECPIPSKGGRYTTPGYMDIPIDDDGSPGKPPKSPMAKTYPVKLEKLEYDFECDGNDLLLSHLEEIEETIIDSKDIKDESIKLYDVAMEKLEILESKSSFVQISDKLDKFLEYAPQTVQIDPASFNSQSKKNISKVRTGIMTNMELQ